MKQLIKHSLSFNNLFSLLLLLLVFNCQKDDTSNLIEEEAQVEKTNAINLSAKEIPSHILDFVKTKTNNTFKVSIAKNNVKLSTSNVNEYNRETPLGIVQTNKVVQVYNEHNIKYTFKVSDPINASSVINLVVVDMDGDIIEYFIQYIFDPNIPIPYTSTGVVDMARFSGAIIFYDNEGISIGNYILNDGNLVSFEGVSEPCDDDVIEEDDDEDDDEDDTTSNGGSGSGGETLPDDPNNNDDNGYDPGNGGNGVFANSDDSCGFQIFYGDCGCGQLGENDGHEKNTNSHCCNGSPTTLYNSCNGASYTWNRNATSAARAGGNNETSPCGGEVGVLIEIDVLIDDIEECLGIESEWLSNEATFEQINQISQYLDQNQCSEQAQEIFVEFLENVSAYPFPHCSSFEYSKPPGVNTRACAVTNLTETFYAYGEQNGQLGTFVVTAHYSIVFFTMPTWMTNGQAATNTAIAVQKAFKMTKDWFYINYDATEAEIQFYLDSSLIQQMALFGGTKTDIPPFNIPSPAPYTTSLFGTGNCN